MQASIPILYSAARMAREEYRHRAKKRKLEQYQKVENVNNPHSLLVLHYNCKKKKKQLAKYIEEALPQYYNNIFSQVYLGAQGTQYYYALPAILDNATLTNINQSFGTSVNSETRFFIEYVDYKFEITNFSSEVNEVDIYVVKTKDNLGTGFSPIDTIEAGFDAKYSRVTNPKAYLRPWMNPLESTVFRQYYNIEHHQKITLDPGQCLKDHMFFRYDKFFDSQYLSAGVNGTGVAPVNVKGWTRQVLVRGCGITVTSGTGVASLSKISHAVVASMNIKFRTPQGPSTNQYLGYFTGTALDTTTVMKNDDPETKVLTNIS